MIDQEYRHLSAMLQHSVRAALQAGAAIMNIYCSESLRIRRKEDDSPLTNADEAAHKSISKALKTSGIPVLSEEGSRISYDIRKNWGELWLIDPLDGTKEFLGKNGEFTVNIALINNNLPVIGVVYAPAMGTMFFYCLLTGSYRVNIPATAASEHSEMNKILAEATHLPGRINKGRSIRMVVSRSHLNDETKAYLELMKNTYGNIEIVSRGSALKFCLVAEGEADIYPRFGPTFEWDTAAGHAVAAYAGCQVVRYPSGESLHYNKPDLLNPWFIIKRGKL
jgi:3'(2'), 5'-bisphosphate nucleotidase